MAGFSIEVKNLKKQFNGREVLRGVDFKCRAGESVVILGESGTGKSVMMRIIGMMMDADSGSVKIDGREIVGISERKMEKMMKNVGFLFQNSALFEHLPVWENIMFYQLFIQNNENDAKEKAAEIMSVLDIPESVMYLRPTEISGGLRRRVALARTIIKQPSLILLDEPTTGLDPIVCESVNSVINQTKKYTGATLITITHDLKSALQIADKIIILRDGKVLWQSIDNARDILNCEDEYVKRYVSAVDI